LFAGFALGAHVASVIGFDFPLGEGFVSYIQTHGHLQLVGWAGLFIIGISLHFIPRLAGVPIQKPENLNMILRLIAFGLLMRFFSHAVLPYLLESRFYLPVAIIVLTGGILVWCGILLYLFTLIQTIKQVQFMDERPALKSVQPFFKMMFAGWFLYPTINVLLIVDMMLKKVAILNQGWNAFSVQMFIYLVLLPVAFAFSVRMFPLYLRLPAIDWPVQKVALIYFISVCLQHLPTMPPILTLSSNIPRIIANIGTILNGMVILWFIWKLDLLTRRREPWTVFRRLQPLPDRRPTREGIPDYGEFGKFEWLVYTSYFWLIAAAVIELILGMSFFLKMPVSISTDALRHTLLLGFVTQLILGMSVRMIPGFIKKKRLARPQFVVITFWLVNIAVIARVLPLILPISFVEFVPFGIQISQGMFGLSGVFAIAAVAFLAVNLNKTAKT